MKIEEYSLAEILVEMQRRSKNIGRIKCDYCGRHKYGKRTCKFKDRHISGKLVDDRYLHLSFLLDRALYLVGRKMGGIVDDPPYRVAVSHGVSKEYTLASFLDEAAAYAKSNEL